MQLTVRQAAAYFGVDESKVRRWITTRGLPVHQAHERFHLNAIEVWEWAVAHGVTVSRRLLDEARRSPDEVPPLAQLLTSGGIHREVAGKQKREVLASVVARLRLPEEVDREHVLAVLEAREAMGSTGIGGGIAIPHVRNPILLHVDRPFVALFLLQHPVDFDSLDGQPVHTLFFVVSSSIPVHLRILAELGFVLRDQELRDLLARRATDAAILERIGDRAIMTTDQHPVARLS